MTNANKDKPAHEHLREKPKAISKAAFDEATGTLTLRLANEEEIAENDRLLAMVLCVLLMLTTRLQKSVK